MRLSALGCDNGLYEHWIVTRLLDLAMREVDPERATAEAAS
jgi:hypothetical protein